MARQIIGKYAYYRITRQSERGLEGDSKPKLPTTNKFRQASLTFCFTVEDNIIPSCILTAIYPLTDWYPENTP